MTAPKCGWYFHLVRRSGHDERSAIPEGAAVLHLGTDRHRSVRLEWNLWSHGCRVSLDLDALHDNDATIAIAMPPVAVYLTVPVPQSLFRGLGIEYRAGRDLADRMRSIGLRVHDWKVWWSLWERQHEWRRSDPWWMRGTIDPIALLFGEQKPSARHLCTARVEIPMPEGSYPASIEWHERMLTRPRWPFRGPAPMAVNWLSYTITPDRPIGFPGKGENSWDCGDDALHSQSGSALTDADAIGAVVASVLRTRQKRGGSLRFAPSERGVAA